MTRTAAVFAEIIRSARAKMTSAVLIALVTGGALAIIVTTVERGSALSSDVQRELDSAESRTITVRASPEDGLATRMVRQLSNVAGVSRAVALGPSTDVTNGSLPGGPQTSMRRLWAGQWKSLGVSPPVCGAAVPIAFGTREALARLGIDSIGTSTVVTQDGVRLPVRVIDRGRTATLPSDDSLVIPSCIREGDAVSEIDVTVRSVAGVRPVLTLVKSVLPKASPPSLTVSSHEAEAASALTVTRALDLDSRRGLVASLLGAGALVAVIQTAVVALRRRDFGRRRAIGATRGVVVALVVGEAVVTSSAGCLASIATTSVLWERIHGTTPSLVLSAALATLMIATASSFAVLPAVLASRVDPAFEMRSP